MTKPKVPGSQQELYTVSVESMPQYKSRCCQRERLCKDLLCVTLIALGVICLAVAIFLIVFFLASDPNSGSLGRSSNDTAEPSKFERQREEELNVNKIDNPTTEIVDIHHHDDEDHHGHDHHEHDHEHDHHHDNKHSPEYKVSPGLDDTNVKSEPQPEPQPEPEPLPVTDTPAVTEKTTVEQANETGAESILPVANPASPDPASQNSNQSTRAPQIIGQSTTATSLNVDQSNPVSSVNSNQTPSTSSGLSEATTSRIPQSQPDLDKWSVVNTTDLESKLAETSTTRVNATRNVTVTEIPTILVPAFDNSPWKPISVPETDQNQTFTKEETVSVSVTDRNATDSVAVTPRPKQEEQTVKISLEDAVPVIPSDQFLFNATAAETEVPELATEIVPEAPFLNETKEPLISTQSPLNLPSSTQKDTCIRRNVPLCKGILPYPETKLPNWVGDNTEVEKNLTLPFIEAIVNSECSQRVQQYACAVLEPPCSNGVTLPPCRKFCRAIAEDCKQYVPTALNLAKVFDCNQFPDSTDPDVCINLAASSDEGECLDGEFHCGDNTCIPENWVCDGKNDCSDGDDEFTCVACREGEFRCEVGNRCVPNTWRCDGSPDCKDGSDERNCNPSGECPDGQFRCEDGLSCIPKRWVCDGSNHCRDNSDETNCTAVACQNDDFKCRESGLCIPRIWVCDNNWDCKDGSDEESCIANNSDKDSDLVSELRAAESASNTTAADPDICPLGEIFCIAGRRCIRIEQLCDGQEDCADGADERDCKQS